MNCIKLHHVILHCKAELDQLMTGAQALGLIEEIQHKPQLFEPLFVVTKQSSLSAGEYITLLKLVMNFVFKVCS